MTENHNVQLSVYLFAAAAQICEKTGFMNSVKRLQIQIRSYHNTVIYTYC